MSGCCIIRFATFSLLYGIGDCDIQLTILIGYMKFSFSDSYHYFVYVCGTVTLISVYFLLDYISCPFQESTDIVLPINKITRMYCVIMIFFHIIIFKNGVVEKEKNLEKEAIELDRLEESELGFMRRFSHFSKTNLNGVINFPCMLKNELSDFPELEHHFDMIEHSAMDIIYQTNNFVEYYQSRHPIHSKRGSEEEASPKTDKGNEDLDYGEKVSSIRDELKYVINTQEKLRLEVLENKKDKIKVLLNVSNAVPKRVLLKRSHILQILNNTLSNSFKYTEEGSIKVNINVAPNPEDVLQLILIIRIVDTGKGIDRNMLAQVFQPYVMNFEEGKKGDESFSIGLYGVKNTIENVLKGSITIESEGVNKGTTCEIRIPVTPVKEELSPPAEEEKKKEEEKEEKRELVMINGDGKEEEDVTFAEYVSPNEILRVLIVEDNIINEKVFEKQISEILNEPGIDLEIHKARNGLEGLKILSRYWQDDPITICDLEMPVMNGYTFVSRARELYERELVIYCLTATICKKEELHEFDGFASKPVSFKAMKTILSYMLRERKARIEKYIEKEQEESSSTSEEEQEDEEELEGVRILEEEEKSEREEEEEEVETPSILKKSVFEKRNYDDVISRRGYEKQKQTEKTIFYVDVVITICTHLTIMGIPSFFPLESVHRTNWSNYVILYSTLAFIQYFVLPRFMKVSVETNSISTILRTWTTLVFGCMPYCSVLKYMKLGGAFQVYLFIQTIQSVKSFKWSFILCCLILSNILLYEVTRDDLKYGILSSTSDTQLSPTLRRNYGVADMIAWYYFLGIIVKLPFVARYTNEQNKFRLEGIIKEFKDMEKDINHMMSRMSHDLATPAQIMLCNLHEIGELLFSSRRVWRNISEAAKEAYRDLAYSSISLECSIRNFLYLCKVRNRMFQAICIYKSNSLMPTFRLKDQLVQMVKKLSYLKKNYDGFQDIIKLEFDDVFNDPSFRIRADLQHVQLILFNLIINSFTHSGNPDDLCIRINVKLQRDENENIIRKSSKRSTTRICEIMISDNGVGLDKRKLEYIFGKIHKSMNNNNNNESKIDEKFRFKEIFPDNNTLGLGLIVCVSLCNQLGGEFEIVENFSSDGEQQQSAVRFTFPCKLRYKKVEEEEEPEKLITEETKEEEQKQRSKYMKIEEDEKCEESEEDEGEEEEEEQQQQDTKKKRLKKKKRKQSYNILLIDDQVTVLTFMNMYVRKLGFRNVKSTNQWQEAVEFMKREKFNIVVSDYRLNDKMKCLRMFAENEHRIQFPDNIIVLSGDDRIMIERKAKMLGVPIKGVIPKPITIGLVTGYFQSFFDFVI